MTQPPTDDQPLKDFLRRHAGTPPAPKPDLEKRIMAAVAASVPSRAPAKSKSFFHRRFWAVAPAIAASLANAWGGGRLLIPSRPSAAEKATLATFLENSWDSVEVDSQAVDAEPDWMNQRVEE